MVSDDVYPGYMHESPYDENKHLRNLDSIGFQVFLFPAVAITGVLIFAGIISRLLRITIRLGFLPHGLSARRSRDMISAKSHESKKDTAEETSCKYEETTQ